MNFNTTYQGLNAADKAALNEAITNLGITDYASLVKAVDMAQTFMCEATNRMTFEQFRRSKVAQTMDSAWCQEQGLDLQEAAVLMYDEQCYIIIIAPGDYNLIINSCEWVSNDLESLERILYDFFYG